MTIIRVATIVLAAATAVAGAVVSVVLGRGEPGHPDRLAITAVVLAYAAVAVVILGARPGNTVGRLMLAGVLAWGVGEGLLAVGVEGAVTAPGSVPGPDALAAALGVVGTAVRGLGWLVLTLLLALLFPDGRTAWPGRRLPVLVAGAAITAFTLAALLSPVPLETRLAPVGNPIGLPASAKIAVDAVALLALALAGVTLAVAVGGLVSRWRRGDELLHQQLLWFAIAFACPLLLLPLIATPWAQPWMFAAVALPVPLAVAVALLQRRLYDVTLVVSRTVTYVLLSAAVAGLYALTVGGVGALLREQGAPWLPWAAAGVVAVSFAPLRNALQQTVNRVAYGQWSEPAAVLAAGGRRLADATNVPVLLASLAEDLGTSLGFGRVEIRDEQARLLAEYGAGAGAEPADLVDVPLTAYGVPVGVLRHSPRRLRSADRDLLADVARQLGGVVHAAALVDRVREQQQRLVMAGEEERRRLRRDLHDGLGPSLAALTLQVDTLRNRARAATLVAMQPVATALDLDAELLRLRAGIAATVVDVRRVVEGLRPPALDEDGIEVALGRMARMLASPAGLGLSVEVALDAELPAAVELAVYRVAQEAVTNVVRHAGAREVRVRLDGAATEVRLEVSDDGSGRVTPRAGGLGLVSMRERAEQLGGTLEIRAREGRGTSVAMAVPVTPTMVGAAR